MGSAGKGDRVGPTRAGIFGAISVPGVFHPGAWQPANTAFRDALTRLEPSRRHRVLVVLDENLLRAQPSLPSQIDAYFAAHAGSLNSSVSR